MAPPTSPEFEAQLRQGGNTPVSVRHQGLFPSSRAYDPLARKFPTMASQFWDKTSCGMALGGALRPVPLPERDPRVVVLKRSSRNGVQRDS